MGTGIVSSAVSPVFIGAGLTTLNSTIAQRRQAAYYWTESDMVRMVARAWGVSLIYTSSYVIPDSVVSGVHCKLYA